MYNEPDMKITLLVPTLNEITGMKTIMPKVHKDWCDQILVVDGQSTDGTIEFARQQGYEVVVQKKKGMRHAYMEALPYVKGDVILTFSPDQWRFRIPSNHTACRRRPIA